MKSLAGLLALLLLPAVAGAEPVALVGPKVDVVCSDMAVAANGSAVVGWGEGQETITLVAASRARRRHPVKVALGSVDGSFPVVQTLGHVREATCPQLATDASGNAIAAWEDDRGRVRVAERQANSRFGAARAVSGRKSAELSVASAASGAAAIAWLGRRGKIEVIVRQPGAPFGAPVALPATEPAALEVAVNERGSVLVTDEEDHSRARVWLSQAGRHFGPAEGIPGSALLTSYVTTAFGADDSVVALLNGPRGHETGIDVTFRPSGGRFAAPRPLTRTGDFARVVADAAGNFTAAWTAYTGDGHPAGVEVDSALAGSGAFSQRRRLAGPGAHFDDELSLSPNGHRLVTWGQNFGNGRHSFVRAALGPPGAELGRVQTVERRASGEYSPSGIDDTGRGLVAYGYESHSTADKGLFVVPLTP